MFPNVVSESAHPCRARERHDMVGISGNDLQNFRLQGPFDISARALVPGDSAHRRHRGKVACPMYSARLMSPSCPETHTLSLAGPPAGTWVCALGHEGRTSMPTVPEKSGCFAKTLRCLRDAWALTPQASLRHRRNPGDIIIALRRAHRRVIR